MAWIATDEAVLGETPRVICNFVYMTLNACMTLGALSIIVRRNLTLARASAVLATVPFVGWLVMPFGLWACVSLFTRDAERDFS